MLATTLQTAVIMIREGLEAFLVILALTAYVTKANVRGGRRAIYAGAIAAVAAILVLGRLFEGVFDRVHDSLLEALALLVIAALMLVISGWVMLGSYSSFWTRLYGAGAAAAVSGHANWSLATVAFVAVFREGVEVMLILYALASTTGGWTPAITLGLTIGSALLVVLFFILDRLADRLPLKLIFMVTSAFLFLMGLKLIGAALECLQELGYVPATALRNGAWLKAIGLNPTWEALLAQAAVVALALASFATFARGSRAAALRD